MAGLILLFVFFSRILSIYLSARWFESLGYSSVYWYIFNAKALLFIGFAVVTALLLSVTFRLFQRLFGAYAFESRTIILNKPPRFISYERQDDKAWDGRRYVIGAPQLTSSRSIEMTTNVHKSGLFQ